MVFFSWLDEWDRRGVWEEENINFEEDYLFKKCGIRKLNLLFLWVVL